ncbi:MAG TPA: hypothetical protein VH063_08355 [Gaiellaceae bacterium]|jgi:hypothetical protein|nr:hypothetical protein [Gaiellaceae bacterium]
MATARISTDKPDLAPVLGDLGADADALTEELASADEKLTGVVETMNERGGNGFHSDGVILETELSGQALIKILVEDAKGAVSFSAELRPSNFYGSEDHPWQPGRPPMVMSTDAWDVGGEVAVRFKTRVAGRPYTIQEQVFEIAEKRHETPKEAVDAFAAVCAKLTDLALSRDPTLQGWKPEIPAAVGGPPIQ